MQRNLSNEILQTSLSVLIDRTTLWDNSSKDDDNKQEKCVAPLTDNAWQSVGSIQDLIDSKYGLNTYKNSNNNEIIPWTNSDLQQV
ncbi:unnamed protein product [Rotaria sordida]|uniref:Uncharacterized protein n=1 Tax=Rotaria sordida TaxID=392033 RepID=A0A815UZZ1_9BILA|nr:unnamed protein product [Rotaria sordida]CAF1241074.1 unnamed protein product [Rotaria sordida]CAF1523072.1 unnamed protein product [Rotaria sordida]CAF1523279.1 unnamed protein product [Rotaria sordida]